MNDIPGIQAAAVRLYLIMGILGLVAGHFQVSWFIVVPVAIILGAYGSSIIRKNYPDE